MECAVSAADEDEDEVASDEDAPQELDSCSSPTTSTNAAGEQGSTSLSFCVIFAQARA